MDDRPDSDGARIRRLRKRAGLTQEELGRLVGRSQAWVSGMEGGTIPLDSVALIVQVARALKVHPSDIAGAAIGLSTDAESRAASAVREIRRAMQRFDLAPDWPVDPRPRADLAATVRHLIVLRRTARYADLAEAVPDAIREIHAAACAAAGTEREALFALLAAAHKEADTAAHVLGHDDLATLAIERFRWAAGRAADPALSAVGDYLRVRDLWALRLWADAADVIDARVAALDGLGGAAQTVVGSLHLRGAVTAARALDPDGARARIAEARTALALLPDGGDPYELTFTAANIDIHAVSIEVEAGNGARAMALAAATELPPGTPRSRAARYRMDVARGCVLHGDHRRGLASMLAAERLAPLLVRNNRDARAAVAAMLSHGRGAGDERLRGLAARLRVS